MLAESNRIAPLTGIEIPEVDGPSPATVPARYRLGDQAVTTQYTATLVGDSWRVNRAFTWLDLNRATAYGRNPVLINRVRLQRPTVYVFPGSYRMSSANRYTTFVGQNLVTVTGTGQPPSLDGIRLRISDAGLGAVRSGARASLAACQKQRKLRPENCPMGVDPSGYRVDAKTLRWKRIGSDPVDRATVRFDPATLEAVASVRIRLEGTLNGRSAVFRGTCTVKPHPDRPGPGPEADQDLQD